jgi:hypothetical protein
LRLKCRLLVINNQSCIIAAVQNAMPGVISRTRYEDFANRHRFAVFATIGILAGMVQAWTSRGTLGTDLLNYLALAQTLVTSGWTASANAFWSPLYSWLLAIPMWLHLLSASNGLFWIHVVNFGIFCGSILCFHVFLNNTLKLAAARVGADNLRWARIDSLWYFCACGMFFFAVFGWLPNSLSTPDLLVGGLILLSAGLLAAIALRDAGWSNYLVLGLSLGLAYLAKAPAFPLALLFLISAVFLSNAERSRWAKCLGSFAMFVLVAGPFIYILSKQESRPTFGESGRVAFLMYGDGWPAYWLGEIVPGKDRAPMYDVVCSDLPVVGFRDALPGVHPPSYAPSRWYAGIRPTLRVRQEILNLRANWHILAEMLFEESDLFAGFLVLLLLAGWNKGIHAILQWWFLWLPAFFGIAIFVIVHVEDRFIAPFLVLGTVGLYLPMLVANARKPGMVSRVLLAVLITQAGRALPDAMKSLLGSKIDLPSSGSKEVAGLTQLQVPPGTKVAIIGFAPGSYWAWIGQYPIVGEIPPSGTGRFLAASPRERERIYGCLSKTGAEAVAIRGEYPQLLHENWKKVGPEDLYVRVLNSVAQRSP